MADATTAVSAMQWQQRPLLIFSATGDARLIAQREAVAHGYAERDIHIVTIVGDAVAGAADSAAALRRRYHIEPGAFTVILIGKDGGEKLRSAAPLPADRLFATIDAMPMRRDEMRR